MDLKQRVLLSALDSESSNTLTLFKASIAMETYARLVLDTVLENYEGRMKKEEKDKIFKETIEQLNKK